jgi:hypothetical protein
MTMGHTYTLVMASHLKWILQAEMPADMRLTFLSHLEKMVDQTLTPEILAMVEPMDERGLELWNEAAKLGFKVVIEPGVGRRPDAFDVLYKKFDIFASLNPSLQRAYEAACRPWATAAS